MPLIRLFFFAFPLIQSQLIAPWTLRSAYLAGLKSLKSVPGLPLR